jgi:hypothetical protein
LKKNSARPTNAHEFLTLSKELTYIDITFPIVAFGAGQDEYNFAPWTKCLVRFACPSIKFDLLEYHSSKIEEFEDEIRFIVAEI